MVAHADLEELVLEHSIDFEPPALHDGHHSMVASSTVASIPLQGNGNKHAAWLLPFTEMFSKRRQFACDHLGMIHLIVGKQICQISAHNISFVMPCELQRLLNIAHLAAKESCCHLNQS